VKNLKIQFVCQKDVHGMSKDVIVLRKAGQGIEDLNSVEIVCEEDDSAARFDMNRQP